MSKETISQTEETANQPKREGVGVRRLVRYLLALRRSLISYESDMGGWKERLQWEMGNADGDLGLPPRVTEYDHPYEHGYYVATH